MKFLFLLLLLVISSLIFANPVFAQYDEKLVVLETNSGTIMIEFFPEDASNHVENFIELVESGFYDGTIFHRIISDFMIQGGDPNTISGDPSTWGKGNSNERLDAEFNTIKHNRGIVSMARSSDPNSATSQFFIVHKDANFLDKQYTVFGRIVTEESFQTLDKIAAVQTGDGDRPVDKESVTITKTTIVNRSDVSNILELSEPERTDKVLLPCEEVYTPLQASLAPKDFFKYPCHRLQDSPDQVKEKVPGWIKNNAKWWADGSIDDDSFVSGIQFLMKEKIVNIPDLPEQASEKAKPSFVDETKDPQHYIDRYNNEPEYKAWFDENYPDYTIEEAVGITTPIPGWIKNTASWWSEGLISEDEFIKGIEFLIEKRILKVESVLKSSQQTETKSTMNSRVASESELQTIDCTNITNGAILIGCDFNGLDLHKKNLSYTNFSGANLSGVNFSAANLDFANLSGADLTNTRFDSVDLTYVNFSGANFTGANLGSAKIYSADLTGADLQGNNFSNKHLKGVNFKNANLSGVLFLNSEMHKANLSGANLSGADFTSADLRGADLTLTNSNNAKFDGARLTSANFTGANLSNAYLRTASLLGANFDDADLRGAVFTGCVGKVFGTPSFGTLPNCN